MASGPRTVIHVDMDAFFVAVELQRRPELRGKPVVVGGAGPRGVVAAASYEARRYGVHSAMPSSRARRLCPDAVFLSGDHARYEAVSRELHVLFHEITPLVEPISLDEAFLDVTGGRRLHGDGLTIGTRLRARVLDVTGLTCSVGVAPSKLLAKLASEAAKPVPGPAGIQAGRGVVVVEPGEERAFLDPLPVEALWGVGPATLARLHRLGVERVADLAATPVASLVNALGEAHGRHLHELAHGIDPRPVEPDRDAKSIGHEETFPVDMTEPDALAGVLVRQADAVAARLRDHGLAARTVQIKVRFGDFHTITRAVTLDEPVATGPAVAAAAQRLLATVDVSAGVRLLGTSASGLGPPPARQLRLDLETENATGPGSPTGPDQPDPRSPDPSGWEDASQAVDDIRRRYGDQSIGPARLLGSSGLRPTRRGQQAWGPDRPDDAGT
jgi:DNA polymerase-4